MKFNNVSRILNGLLNSPSSIPEKVSFVAPSKTQRYQVFKVSFKKRKTKGLHHTILTVVSLWNDNLWLCENSATIETYNFGFRFNYEYDLVCVCFGFSWVWTKSSCNCKMCTVPMSGRTKVMHEMSSWYSVSEKTNFFKHMNTYGQRHSQPQTKLKVMSIKYTRFRWIQKGIKHWTKRVHTREITS